MKNLRINKIISHQVFLRENLKISVSQENEKSKKFKGLLNLL